MEAFVIQPIRDRQDPDHDHFRAIYGRVREVLTARGYGCYRADEVSKSGAITKDIVTRLGSADLVVADLTDLNPNVYYELGVRHALRGSGTMLLVDEVRTKEIPFDLSAYRVIRFEGTVPGIGRLEDRLIEALDQQSEYGPKSDNPVHDWLPELPANALAAADGSEAGELRRQLKEQEDAVSRYRDRFGVLDGPLRGQTSTPLSVVMGAVAAAREGNTPSQLARDAEEAVQTRDVGRFLSVIRRVLENDVKIDKGEARTLAFGADRLGLDQVGRAVLDYVAGYLDDDDLQQASLAKLAHSSDPEERALARRELARRSGIEQKANGEITLPSQFTKMQTIDLALLMDALDRDGDYHEAFAVAYSWVANVPRSSFALRHLARCYGALGERPTSLQAYRAALGAPDVDDTTARWLGSDYHNANEIINSLEAYALSASYDPDDSNLFAHTADELSTALRNQLLGRTAADGRELPGALSLESFEICVLATLSCKSIDQEAIQRIEMSANRIDTKALEFATEADKLDLTARHGFASDLLRMLSSPATEPMHEAPGEGWPNLGENAGWKLASLGADTPASQADSPGPQ